MLSRTLMIRYSIETNFLEEAARRQVAIFPLRNDWCMRSTWDENEALGQFFQAMFDFAL